MRSVVVSLFFCLILVSGCQTTGPKFVSPTPPSAEKAVIYIYRPFNMMGGSDIPAITDNGEDILPGLPTRCWWRYETKPGVHVLSADAPLARETPVSLVIKEPGEIRYVRVEYEFGVPYAFRLVETPKAAAQAEMKSLYEVITK